MADMKKIVLASRSPQRRKLLKLLGMKFSVAVSRIAEKNKVQTTCSALVKENALRKALDVASRLKKGIVIGADTVVYVGNKRIMGKPKNLPEARRILKILFSSPQWVYTGVAIMDVASGKKLVGYEKTRVFMLPLNDKEIAHYHAKVKPFDKAGGFDIEGWGSIFIHRIEGCYSNVIGLPMAKLCTMLKKMGVNVLSLVLMAVILTGCSTEYNLATQQQETLMYTSEREVALGDSVAQAVEKKYEVVEEVDENERVKKILDRIVEVCDRKDILYFIHVLDDDMMNAVSLPGGYIYVFKGLMDKVDSDDQLAGVIAHEIGHITARHGVKKIQSAYGAIALQVLSTEAGGDVAAGVNVALNTLFSEYSQEDEFEADRLAVKYMKKAGYNPEGMVEFLKKLQGEQKKDIRPYIYWKTHPNLSKRIAVVNKEIKGSMGFRDYLNLIGE